MIVGALAQPREDVVGLRNSTPEVTRASGMSATRRTQPVLMEAVHPAQLSLPQAHGTSGLALTLGLWGDSLTAVS